MTRGLTATNITETEASHLHEVVLVKLEFDTPVYVHSGFGTITYDSNDYLGVGQFGSISATKESELLGPQTLTLTLSGVTTQYINEALDSGNYGDVITIYVGYRNDDGTLKDDPWLAWKGTYEYASISLGAADNVVEITCAHDLQILNDSDGSRYSEESQKDKHPGDTGLDHVARMASLDLLWGGGPVRSGISTAGSLRTPIDPRGGGKLP